MLELPFSGCGVQVSNDVELGRTALKVSNPELAVTFFQRTAESQSDYVVDTPPLRQGIWTYLGRAYYDAGRLSEAHDALSRALTRDSCDFIARLYLGLVMLRPADPDALSVWSRKKAPILNYMRRRKKNYSAQERMTSSWLKFVTVSGQGRRRILQGKRR